MGTPSPTSSPEKQPVKFPYPLTVNKCQMCGNDIRTMCYMGTGVCSLNCKKARDGE